MSGVFQARFRPLPVLVVLVAAMSVSCSESGTGPGPDAGSPAAREAVEPAAKVAVDDSVLADESLTSAWPAYGGTHYERRFSPLTDINAANVGELRVDWYLDLPRDVGLVSTPLVVDGVLYFSGTMNVVRAVDAVTGELLWEFHPQVGERLANKRQAGFVSSRGITFCGDKVFAATWDGRLIAIDAKTGRQVWSATTFPPDAALYITGAPKAFKGKVLIGNGGTEVGPNRGFENAAMEMAAATWTGEWWRHGGGGNAWHGFTYDPDLDAVYIGTGNGSPWNRNVRSPGGGDNLFLCSIVALDPDTGEYRWHYQTTPGETWDYNSNMDIVLADLTIGGEPIKALLHAPKNGFFYVIDRRTGKLVSAEPFADVNWATHVDLETGRPVEVEGARYESGRTEIAPGPWGAHSWHAMSYNPLTGLVYLPTLHMAFGFDDAGIDTGSFQAKPFQCGVAVNLSSAEQPRDYPGSLEADFAVDATQAGAALPEAT